MSEAPRPPKEPIINRLMVTGIIVQTVAITSAVLGAYLIGLRLFPDIDLMADTMAFTTLSFSELLRAFSSRSERRSLFSLGLFTNKAMFYAVAASIVLLVSVIYIPFLQPVFNTVPLGWLQWRIVGPLMLLPTIAAEVMKAVLGRKAVPSHTT